MQCTAETLELCSSDEKYKERKTSGEEEEKEAEKKEEEEENRIEKLTQSPTQTCTTYNEVHTTLQSQAFGYTHDDT